MMNRVYILLVFLLPVMMGCTSVHRFYRENSVLVGIIERSVGKPVSYFYDELEANAYLPQNLTTKAMEDEEYRTFGIEMKMPLQGYENQSEIVVRIRFDMHKEDIGFYSLTDKNRSQNRPKVFEQNGKYIVEFIRVIEYTNGKITFSRIFDKSTAYSVPIGDELVAVDRLKMK